MTAGPWVDRAFVGVLPDLSRFASELDRGITRALNDVERHVNQAGGRVTRRFQDMARDAGRALDGIGGSGTFGGLEAQAGRAAEGIEGEFRDAQRDADRALRGIGGPGQFRDVERQADRAADRISHDFLRARTSASFHLGGLTTRASVAGGLIGAALGTVGTAAVTMGLQSAAAMEQAEISFTQLLGSGQKAKGFLADLNRFAATTPFELPGLIASSRQLLGAGQAAKDVIPIMTALGDATGALGLEQDAFQRIMLAVTQAMNKGRLQGEELMQMQEAGLPVTAMLAKALGVTTKQVSELSEAGKLQSDVVLPKLFDQMHKDYGGSMIKQSRTLNGLWSTFVDTTRNALREGIQPLLPAIKDALPEAARILEGAIRSVVGFFRDDLGPELGRIKLAWDENGAAILGLFTSMASGRGEMDASATAAHSLADGLVALTGALGDLSRFGNQVATFLNNLNQGSQNLADSINDRLQPVWDHFIHRTALGEGTLRIWNRVVGDVGADLEDLGIRLDFTSDDTDQAASAAERHTQALRDEKTAVNDLKGALKDEHDAHLDLRQAQLNVAVTEKRLTDLKRDGKRGSLEYRQAQISLARAQTDLDEKTRAYTGAVHKSTDAERTAASAMERAKPPMDRLGESARTGGNYAAGARGPWKGLGSDIRNAYQRMSDRVADITARFHWSGVDTILRTFTAGGRGGQPVIQRSARGGRITEGSGPTADDVLRWVSRDEAIVPARSATKPEFRVWAAREGIPGFAGYAAPGFQAGGVPRPTTPRFHMRDQEGFVDSLAKFNRNIDTTLQRAATRFDRYMEQFAGPAGAAGGFLGGAGGPGGWRWQMAVLRRQFPGLPLISGFRPGAITSTGHTSYHALGRAVDVPPRWDVFNWISANYGRRTKELIFTPAGARQIHNGQFHVFTGGTIQQDHYNHVHWAYDRGGYLRPGWSPAWNGTSSRERVLDPVQTRVWEALEKQLRTTTTRRVGLPTPPSTSVNVQAGAVQVIVQGSVTHDTLPELRASVEAGLHAVLRELETGAAA